METVLSIIGIISGIIGVIISVYTLFSAIPKLIRWVDMVNQYDADLQSIRHEQSIMTVGILACLKSIAEDKKDPTVINAISAIENHLNEQAHKK